MSLGNNYLRLFETTKIQIYETNLQLQNESKSYKMRCLRLQRYKFMKPIYSSEPLKWQKKRLFETTKIQIYETNLQPLPHL